MRLLSARSLVLLAALLGVFAAAGCGSERTQTKMNVVLRDWAIDLSQSSAPAGDVTFNVDNKSQSHQHELQIIRTDFAPDKLPTKSDGSVDTGANGIDVAGKIQKFDAGDNSAGIYTLSAGKYVLICNLVDDQNGTKTSHYQQGMRVAFTVQ